MSLLPAYLAVIGQRQSDPLAAIPGIVGRWRHDTNVLAVGGGDAGEGAAVGSWLDYRGTGQTLATAVSSSRPTQRIALGYVEMGADAMEFSHAAIGGEYYIFAAFQVPASFGNTVILRSEAGGSFSNMTLFTGIPQISTYAYDGGSASESAVTGGSASTDNITRFYSSNSYASRGNLVRNLKTAADGSTTLGRPVSPTKFLLSASATGLGWREIILVGGSLTGGELATIADYLNSRYP